MSNRLPLTEVSGEEIIARVTYQIIMADYRQTPDSYDTPSERILILADQWFAFGANDLAFYLRLAGVWCSTGATLASWLQKSIFLTSGRASKLMHATRRPRR